MTRKKASPGLTISPRVHLSPGDFRRLSGFIRDLCGIHMGSQKRAMLEMRLQKQLDSLGLASFTEYCDRITARNAPHEDIVSLVDIVTTNKTDFFREANHFDYLVRELLPKIGQGGWNPARPLLAWSAGCSTGEEPYTLAMVLSDFRSVTPGFRFEVLATDISTRVLRAAHRAVYDEDRIEAVPEDMRRRYLLRSRDPSAKQVRVAPELRKTVSYRMLNLFDDVYDIPEPVDIVFYRNVSIYFDKETQETIVGRVVRHIKPGGWLFLGHSESLFGMRLPLRQVVPTVYVKDESEQVVRMRAAR